MPPRRAHSVSAAASRSRLAPLPTAALEICPSPASQQQLPRHRGSGRERAVSRQSEPARARRHGSEPLNISRVSTSRVVQRLRSATNASLRHAGPAHGLEGGGRPSGTAAPSDPPPAAVMAEEQHFGQASHEEARQHSAGSPGVDSDPPEDPALMHVPSQLEPGLSAGEVFALEAVPANRLADGVSSRRSDDAHAPDPASSQLQSQHASAEANPSTREAPTPEPAPAACRKASGGDNAALQEQGFAVVRTIGQGAFGKVLLVRHSEQQQLCVAKVIPLGNGELRAARQEAELMKSLRHPYIVNFRSSFDSGRSLFIIMDYCEGGTLKKRIEAARRSKQRLAEAVVVKWLTQALLALKYMHDNRLLHRDLKPENILLTSRNGGDLRITDFGLSRVLEATAAVARTQVGTPYFIAPEVCLERPYASHADVWSLGCITYEMCALRVPFDGANISEVVRSITREQPPPLPSCYSAFLRQTCLAMLIKDPEVRPSASDLIRKPEIQAVVRELLEQSSASPGESSAARGRSSGTKSPALEGGPSRRSVASLPPLGKASFSATLRAVPAAALPAQMPGRLRPPGDSGLSLSPRRRLCDDAAISISAAAAGAFANMSHGELGVSDALIQSEEDAVRAFYLSCIERNPGQILAKLAEPMKAGLLLSEAGASMLEGDAQPVAVAHGDRVQAVEKEIFSIGRSPECDVVVSVPEECVSRMHLWVFNLGGGIVVVDGWSLLGTTVAKQDADDPEPAKSVPGSRRAFVVPHGEATVLQLGHCRILLNPKICVVCMDRPRGVVLACGHSALCSRCHEVTSECPLCREPVAAARARISMGAAALNTYAAPLS